MIVKILGGLDIVVALMLLIAGFGFKLPFIVIVFFGLLLLVKGLLFVTTLASWFDILGALVLFLSLLFVFPSWIFFIPCLLIFQKGILSFLS